MREHRVTLKRNGSVDVDLIVDVLPLVGPEVTTKADERAVETRRYNRRPIDGLVVLSRKKLHSYLVEVFDDGPKSNRAMAFDPDFEKFCRLTDNSPDDQSFSIDLDKLGKSDG